LRCAQDPGAITRMALGIPAPLGNPAGRDWYSSRIFVMFLPGPAMVVAAGRL